ncbi:hypothetical protein KN63_03535 [Smithella sp. F21]|jgi:lipopolysaccharide export system protein LptA|nr:hypothetical protein KN63_03535 [Smithella sp. F21]HCX02723.1 lipopolysaccharide transport periplasmic protein LptA [Syntrophaceae bacterium]
MRVKKIYPIVLLMLFTVNIQAWAQIGLNQKNMLRKNEPIEIVSDKMEAFQANRMVVFSGNAVATQGDVKVQADRLSIYYKESGAKKEKKEKLEVEQAGDLEKIVLKGHVVITQKDILATGDEAVYYQDTAQFVMTGNPVLQQEKTVIKGCKVTIQVDENRGKVEQCTAENSGRVTAVIHPQKKK